MMGAASLGCASSVCHNMKAAGTTKWEFNFLLSVVGNGEANHVVQAAAAKHAAASANESHAEAKAKKDACSCVWRLSFFFDE